jgi:hypothetical protein
VRRNKMETLIKKYPAVVEVIFENQADYDAGRASAINLSVPAEDNICGTYRQPVSVPVDFVHKLRYLEAVKASDGKPETIQTLVNEYTARRAHGA